jgi:hypothetical protein
MIPDWPVGVFANYGCGFALTVEIQLVGVPSDVLVHQFWRIR